MTLQLLLRTLFVNKTDTLAVTQILMALGVALLLATVIGVTYIATQRPSREGRLFALGLVLTAGLMSIATAMIGKNLPLALAHVGALTIVRFRAPISSPVDNVFIFWAVVLGMAVGAEAYLIAILAVAFGTAFLAFVTWQSSRRGTRSSRARAGGWLTVETSGPDYTVQQGIERALRRHLGAATLDRCEIAAPSKICILRYRVRGDAAQPKLLQSLRAIGGVNRVAWGEGAR